MSPSATTIDRQPELQKPMLAHLRDASSPEVNASEQQVRNWKQFPFKVAQKR